VRAEQRWVGLASGIVGRALRFFAGFVITTACLRAFGSATWGTVVIALTATELLLFADFATPELCAYEAARANDHAELRARLGQALWLVVGPTVLISSLLLTAAQLTPHWFQGSAADGRTLRALLIACAFSAPWALGANCLGSALQGLGRLREMNTMHALSGLVELGLVLVLLALRCDVVHVQWARSAAQVGRLLSMLLVFRRLGLAVPVPLAPQRPVLREMVRYCAGLSLLKIIGNAIGRSAVPMSQWFTTTAVIGSYDAVDRLGGVLQRASNPVSDSLFQRFVRSFDGSASDTQRSSGRRDFLAGTLLVVGISASATLLTLNLSAWLFPLWLGRDLARDPIVFAPWVMANWALGLSVSMCGALLIARAQIRACIWVHVLALAATSATILSVGMHARMHGHDGRYALLAGPLSGAVVAAAGMTVLACRSAGIPLRHFLAHVSAVWAPAWLAMAVVRLWPHTIVTVLSTALGLVAIAIIAVCAEPLRSLRREFRQYSIVPERSHGGGPAE